MFSKPGYGWVNIKLDTFEDRASYLTNVPHDILNTLTVAIKHYIPASIYFDAEGWRYILVSDMYETYIISDKNGIDELIHIDKHVIEIAREVIVDIERDLNAWSRWGCSLTPSNWELEKQELLQQLNQLKHEMTERGIVI